MRSACTRTPRLAVVISHPTQYYSPWFRWLASRCKIELRVFYLWDFGIRNTHDERFHRSFSWDVDLLSGYESEFVPNSAHRPGTSHFLGLNNPGLLGRLAAWNPDTVLCFGYAYLSHLKVICWARSRRIPLIFRGDSHFIDRQAPKRFSGWLLRSLFRQFSAFTFVGDANRSYFRQLGVPDNKLFFAPHAVDASLFDPHNKSHLEAAEQLRGKLAIPQQHKVVLFAGKYHPEKQPVVLLDAFTSLAAANTVLVFAGDGEQRAILTERAKQHPNVRFLPFANQSEMPARYLLADIFTLPSIGLYETWGLAVNEAMQMGKPCLVSHRVGCQTDLVSHGNTGWVFDATDPNALVRALGEAVSSDLPAFTPRVLERVAKYSYAAAAEGLQQAIHHAMTQVR